MNNKLRIGLFACMVVAAGVSLIASRTFLNPDADMKREMESRYGERMKVVEEIKEGSTENSKSYKLKGESGEFTCKKYYDNQNNVHFQDNYLAVKYNSDITALLKGIFPEDCDISIDVDSGIYPELENPSKVSMGDFLADGVTYIAVNVDSPHEWSDEKVQELEEPLRGKIKVFCNIKWSNGSYYFTVTPQGDIVDTNLQTEVEG